MERKYLHRVVLACVFALALGGRAWGQAQRLTTELGADSSPMTKFYTGPMVNIGEFPGTLVRLSCDPNGTAYDAPARDRPGQYYALMVQGDTVLHPLLPGTPEVKQELNSVGLHGTDVAVQGKYYPSTGAILVSRIVEAGSSVARDGQAAQDHRGTSPATLTAGGLRLARCAGK